MTTAVYRQCGLRIRSELALDLPVIDDIDGWDLDVRWGDDAEATTSDPPGEPVARFSSDPDSWYVASWTGSEYVFRFRSCGDFLISADLHEVVVRRDPAGEHRALVPVLVAGTIAAAVLSLRGATVLHASAVALGDETVAFTGVSGMGKTTMAAVMCRAGADLVADDLLVVEPGPPATCLGGADELRLRPAAAELFAHRPSVPSRVTADDRVAVSPPAAPPTARPLSAIVVPMPTRDENALAIELVPPSTAIMVLLTTPRVHGWQRPDVLSRDLTVLGRLADDVPTYRAAVPWGPPFDPQIATAIAGLVGSTWQ